MMIIDKTKGPNTSQGYSRRGQVGKLGREGPSVLQTKQDTLAPDFLHMQLPQMRRKPCAANGGVLREAKTVVAEKKTEVNVGAVLAL